MTTDPEPTTEPWRNAPRCPDHEDYREGCEACFREAVEGGLSQVCDIWMPGVVAVEMPAAGPEHAVFEIRFEDQRLFAVTYRNGIQLPDSAWDRIVEFKTAVEANVAFWDDRISTLQEEYEESDGSRHVGDMLHAAKRARGIAGSRLDHVESWSVPVKANPPAAKPGLTIPPGRRAV